MLNIHRRALLTLALGFVPSLALAGGTYDTGATDTEIKIGQTIAYSGPASIIGTLGKAQTAYFNKVNKAGGINGRKVNLISADDAYSPPKTVEATRRLVEQDEVLLISGSNGTATNNAVKKYLQSKSIPQLFVLSGGNFNDPKNFPMMTQAAHSYDTEGRIYAKYILANNPGAKIAILFQNDDYGKDTIRGFKAGLGDRAAAMIVAEASYETTDPTIDSPLTNLMASKADVLLNVSYGKFTAQSIRRIDQSGWKPLHLMVYGASNAILLLDEASRPSAAGIVSATFYKNPADESLQSDPDVVAYKAFLAEWAKDVPPNDPLGVSGFLAATMLEHVLKMAGDNLTRANIVKQATNIRDLRLPMILDGLTITTQPDDYAIFRKGRLQRFDGKKWSLLPEIVAAD